MRSTVKELKKLLETVPDGTTVVIPGEDHGYRAARFELTTGLQEAPGCWTEDHGETVTPEAEYGKRLPILVIGA